MLKSRKIINAALVLISFLLVNCSSTPSLEELQRFAPVETYPEDVFLSTIENKKALIIVAHDDDDCAMSGTIAKLTADGWTIEQLSLVTHIDQKSGKNAAHIICSGNTKILDDGIYRLGLDTMATPYVPIPYKDFEEQFLTEKVAQALNKKINSFEPSIIFTLDNEKGGYGHPDHIFISQLVLDLFKEGKINNQRIYQSVYTDHMEEEIVDKWLKAKMDKWQLPHPSTMANKLYGITGMPEPTVQVTISDHAMTKMAYLTYYPEIVKKNLRKFIPYYDEFNAEEYFSIFDREFFRVLDKE